MDFLATLEYEPPFLSNNPDFVPGVMNLPLDCSDFIAPYVPASKASSKAAVALARLSSQDTLCDLGCGNGKVLQTAIEMIGPELKCVGVELDEKLYHFVKTSLPSIKVIHSNMFTINLVELEISVFILYLLPDGLEKLKDALRDWFRSTDGPLKDDYLEIDNRLKRIVTIGYSIRGWNPILVVQVDQTLEKKDVFTGGESIGLQSVYYYDIQSLAMQE